MKGGVLRNALANLSAGVFPALVTLVTVPITVSCLGEADYGTLALITAIIGYFAIIDINVTSGAVRHIAAYHAEGANAKVYQVISFGFGLYAIIGLLGAAAVVAGAPWFAGSVFSIPPERQEAATLALRIGGAGFLFGQMQIYLQSIPQALGQFRVSARYESLFGVLVPLLTATAAATGAGLVAVVALRVVASVVNVGMLWAAVRRLLPEFRPTRPSQEIARSVLHFSGFAWLARIAAVTYAQADKLVIGALAGVQALTWYVVPFTLVNRVFAMTYRLAAVMFPASSALAARGDVAALRELYLVAVRYTVFLNGAICLALAVLAHSLLSVWIGEEFARHGAVILALLAVASFVDSLTNLPSLVNDGLGHPAVSGLFAVSRAVIGVGATWLLVGALGVLGAAVSQLLISSVMALAFVVFVHGRSVPVPLGEFWRVGLARPFAVFALVGPFGWVLARALGDGLLSGMLVGCVMGACALIAGYLLVLREEERGSLVATWRRWRAA